MAKHSLPTGHRTGSAGSNGPVKLARSRRGRAATGHKLFRFDRELGARHIAGADEAGRGSLAGPLVAAAVLFDYSRLDYGAIRALARLNDSKAHSASGREELFPLVIAAATKVAICSYSHITIDQDGLHKTNLRALAESLEQVALDSCICLVDGFKLPELRRRSIALVDGDRRSAAIAAASVVAKVTRDGFMREADKLYPGWDFAVNVGYSTAEHRAAILANGVSPIHRLSFKSVAYQQLDLEAQASAAA